MVLVVVLGVSASLLWGLADFLGGVQSRRSNALLVVMVSQVSGLVGVAAVAAAVAPALPGAGVLVPAALAGLGTAVGLGAFYRGLAVGTMSVVAPIAATGAAVPVLAGLLAGERPSALQWAGMALASAGVIAAARVGTDEGAARRGHRAGVALALVAACGLGVGLVGLDAAAEFGVLWTLLVLRGVAALTLLAWARLADVPLAPRRADLPVLVLIGLLEVCALGSLALATTTGLLGVVAVLGSLYPLVTVLLALVVLGERLRRPQALGAGAALLGVGLLAAGG